MQGYILTFSRFSHENICQPSVLHRRDLKFCDISTQFLLQSLCVCVCVYVCVYMCVCVCVRACGVRVRVFVVFNLFLVCFVFCFFILLSVNCFGRTIYMCIEYHI